MIKEWLYEIVLVDGTRKYKVLLDFPCDALSIYDVIRSIRDDFMNFLDNRKKETSSKRYDVHPFLDRLVSDRKIHGYYGIAESNEIGKQSTGEDNIDQFNLSQYDGWSSKEREKI